jgi:hypothetical protein
VHPLRRNRNRADARRPESRETPAMNDGTSAASGAIHSHVFLGEGHEKSERKTWVVIWLCGAMMLTEIVGGLLFGSIALVADGLHMSTHAGALLLAALAYTYARKHADDPKFTFGTGKIGDLAGFTRRSPRRRRLALSLKHSMATRSRSTALR